MKQIQPFQKHWLQITSIVVCRLNSKIGGIQNQRSGVLCSNPCQHVENVRYVNVQLWRQTPFVWNIIIVNISYFQLLLQWEIREARYNSS